MKDDFEEIDFGELAQKLKEVNIERDLDEPDAVYELIGAAFYNGYKLTRTPEQITIETEQGPVIDKSEKGDVESQ